MKKIVLLLIFLTIEVSLYAEDQSWVPPIGIPAPSFGINETYRMYDNESSQNPELTYNPSDSGGYYTHYIDADNSGATDSSNPFGTIEKPRKTVPYPLPAGSVVEIHSGTFSYYNFVCNGTEQLPIFIRGIGNPSTNSAIIKGSYVIVDGLYLSNNKLELRPHGGANAHHISIRNCTFVGSGIAAGSQEVIPIKGELDNVFHDIIIYNNSISYYGKYDAVEENDYHGVGIGGYVQNVWIIGNQIHHMGGDSVQIGHGVNWTTHHIYIADNLFHNNYEDGIDLKDCTDIIVSQNEFYSFSTGSAACSHYGSSNPETKGTQRAWFLFNTVHDTTKDIFATSSEANEISYIGNLIYNVDSTAFIGWSHGSIYYMLNTMHNVGGGIDDTGSDTTKCVIVNNIFGTLASGNHITLDYTAYRNNAIVENNLYKEPFSGNKEGTGSYIGDPLFVNPALYDYNLQESSPVNDMETSDQVRILFERFLALYGIDLAADIDGIPRVGGTVVPDNSDEEPSSPDPEEPVDENPETPAEVPDDPGENTDTPSEETDNSTNQNTSDTSETESPMISPLPMEDTAILETNSSISSSLANFSTISTLASTSDAGLHITGRKTAKIRNIKVRGVFNRFDEIYCPPNRNPRNFEDFE